MIVWVGNCEGADPSMSTALRITGRGDVGRITWLPPAMAKPIVGVPGRVLALTIWIAWRSVRPPGTNAPSSVRVTMNGVRIIGGEAAAANSEVLPERSAVAVKNEPTSIGVLRAPTNVPIPELGTVTNA